MYNPDISGLPVITNPFVIGAEPFSTADTLAGYMDEIRVVGRVLTPVEIQKEFLRRPFS